MVGLSLVCIIYCGATARQQDEVSVAEKYLYQSPYTHKNLAKDLSTVGWKRGLNWCAYFVSMILDKTNNRTITIRSPMARKFITKKSIPARRVLQGSVVVKRNWLMIWQRGSTIFGHIGFVRRQSGKNQFSTIEGNTDNKVLNKIRKIQPLSYFRITHFTPL